MGWKRYRFEFKSKNSHFPFSSESVKFAYNIIMSYWFLRTKYRVAEISRNFQILIFLVFFCSYDHDRLSSFFFGVNSFTSGKGQSQKIEKAARHFSTSTVNVIKKRLDVYFERSLTLLENASIWPFAIAGKTPLTKL